MNRVKHRRCEICGEYFETWCNHTRCRQCTFTARRCSGDTMQDYDELEGMDGGQDDDEE